MMRGSGTDESAAPLTPLQVAPHHGQPWRGPALASVLAVAMVWPTVFTWLYFQVLVGTRAMQPVYLAGKLLQFALPVVWVALVERKRLFGRGGEPSSGFGGRGIVLGVMFGFAVLGAGLAFYFALLRGAPLVAGVPEVLRGKLSAAGIRSPGAFVALAVFYCLMHSALEEYFWRWFVFGRMRSLVRWPTAVWVSSLGFMAHHVVLVAGYLSQPLLVVAASLAVAVGGAFWAWLYQRSGSLVGAWLGHLLVDALLMGVGYDLLFVRAG